MLNDYYYTLLDVREKDAYRTLRAALLRRASICNLERTGLDGDAVRRVWHAVVLDNPDIIHYPALFCEPCFTERILRLEYSTIDTERYRAAMDRLCDTISRKLPYNASDYLVCKTVFDVLAARITYDYAVLNEYNRLTERGCSQEQMVAFLEERSAAFTPYGILINRKGVCQGIAKLYMILCERFGVQCACVEATDHGGTEHMLNVVEVGGVRAYVDLTAGLPGRIPDSTAVFYDSFLVSSRLYSRSHTLKREFDCVDETVSYYAKNGLHFRSFERMRRYLSAYTFRSTGGVVRCFYDGTDKSDKELKEAMDYILSKHAESSRRLFISHAEHGFCIGIITNDNTED